MFNVPRYTTFTYLGGTTGTVITLPLCGLLLDKYPWEVQSLALPHDIIVLCKILP